MLVLMLMMIKLGDNLKDLEENPKKIIFDSELETKKWPLNDG